MSGATGAPGLVTDGLSNWPIGAAPDGSHPSRAAVSASGRDLFFFASAQYTQDALDAYRRLYDARIGGGIDFPPPALPPCDLNSGACEGPGSSPSDQPGPGSAVFQGPGNQGRSTNRKPRRCPKGKRKVRRTARCAASSATTISATTRSATTSAPTEPTTTEELRSEFPPAHLRC